MERVWTVFMLGRFELQDQNGRIIPLKSTTPNLILARLLVEGRVSKDALTQTLWPDIPSDKARHSLSVALDTLRKHFGAVGGRTTRIILSDDNYLWLDPHLITSDLRTLKEELEAAAVAVDNDVRLAHVSRCIEIYGGALLDDIEDGWASFARTELDVRFGSVLRANLQALVGSGLQRRALELAMAAASKFPNDDDRIADVLNLLIATGQSLTAAKYYVAYCTHLISAVGRSPTSDIQRIMAPYRAIVKQLSGNDRKTPDSAQAEGTPCAVIPVYPGGFFGRESELNRIRLLFRGSQNSAQRHVTTARHISVVGLGGCGKTRLAAEAAIQLAGFYDGRLLFVEASGARRSEDIYAAILSATGKGAGAEGALDAVSQRLGKSAWILVVNDCKRIELCRSVISELLAACPLLSILSTCRVEIGTPGEITVRLHPLAVPTGVISAETLSEFPSVQLFTEKARLANSNFQITNQSAPIIADLITRLDGVPLAIELAAAHSFTLSPAQMLQQLSAAADSDTAPESDILGMRTVDRTVHWSYRHLTSQARALLNRLVIFKGGFTIGAARAVYESNRAIELLDQLVRSSMVNAVRLNGESRYAVLETVRTYVRKLIPKHEHHLAAVSHAQYVLRFLEDAVPKLRTTDADSAVMLLDDEHENVLAALDNFSNSELALHVGAAAWRYWYHRSMFQFGRDRLEEVLSKCAQSDGAALPLALHGVGVFRDLLGDLNGAESAMCDSLAITENVADYELEHGRTLNSLALLLDKRRTYPDAIRRARQALPLLKRRGDAWDVAGCLNTLGRISFHIGSYDDSEAAFEEALALLTSLDAWGKAALLRFNMGCLASARNDFAKARAAFELGLHQFRHSGNKMYIAAAQHNIGDIFVKQGNISGAIPCLVEALSIRADLSDRSGVAATVELLAAVAYRQPNTRLAVRLAGGAAALRIKQSASAFEGERAANADELARYRRELSPADFEADWLFGSGLSYNELIHYCRTSITGDSISEIHNLPNLDT